MPNPSHISLTVPLALAAPQGAALPAQFSGIAYSGGQVPGYGCVIDLATTQFAATMPLLAEHNRSEIIGVIDSTTNDGANLTVSGKLFSDIPGSCGEQIAQCAVRGAPYQMSVGLFGYNELWVASGSSQLVNGQVFQGPVTVLQGGRVREVSVVALGADPNTDAQFFSAPTHATPNPPKPQGPITMPPTIEELTAQVATLTAQLAAAPGLEQARIQGVEAQSIPGHESLILSLKFDGKSTAGDAAMAVLSAEKKARATNAALLAADAPNPLPLVPPPAVELAAPGTPGAAKSPDDLLAATKFHMAANPGVTFTAAYKAVGGK